MDEGQLGITEELRAELVDCATIAVKRETLEEIRDEIKGGFTDSALYLLARLLNE